MSKRFLICFDWDGTLADSMDLCIRQIELATERMGLPPRPLELMRACNGPAYEQSVPILKIPEELGEAFLQKRSAAEMEIIPAYQKLFPGVKEMLERLSRIADLAIVSNGKEKYLDVSMQLTGVKQYFKMVEPLKSPRPKPEALRVVLDAFGHPDAVMAGDRFGDLEAGRICGIPTIAARYGYGSDEEWKIADWQAGTVGEMEAILTKLAARG